MRKIYNRAGGTKLVDMVDAREHVATGRWSFEPFENLELNLPEGEQTGEQTGEQDATSQQAYNERQAAFQASQAEAEAASSEVLDEIKTRRNKRS